jgi:hypothetical protein
MRHRLLPIPLSVLALMFLLPGAPVAAFPAVTDTLHRGIIPSDRRIPWHPGIPGGIPEIAGPVVSILDYGADPSGMNDSRAAIESAIASLPSSGGVVLIPEGTFRVGSKLTIAKDHVVIRGTGWGSRLMLGASGDGIEVVTYQRGSWQSPGEVRKGDTTLVVENGPAFSGWDFAEIEQDNDPDLMYTDPEWIQDWAENSVGQLFRIVQRAGDTLSFESPVNLDFSMDLNVRIRPLKLVRYVGFEDLYLEKTKAEGNTIIFKNTAYCWVRNVESYHTRRHHVEQTSSLNNEIRDSYFHRSFSYGGGGAGYGVGCSFHTTNTLVENNMFDSLRHAMIIQLGANGNVYGYNYSLHPVQGEGETNLNDGWTPPDISNHGHYAFMNLFEGNELQEVGIGDYWGPAGPGNTYFRNRVSSEGIFYYDASHRQNLVGNETTGITDQDGKAQEKLEHGNVVKGVVQWDPAIGSQELPSSYYLDSVPPFFTEQTWPLFGPDTEGEGTLPARERFEKLPYMKVYLDRNPVGQYQRLELSIENGKAYDNPFDPEEVDLSGLFVSPTQDTIRINGFWDGSWWRIRFAGSETGTWHYRISVRDRDGLMERGGTFQVVSSAIRGWIGPSPGDPHYLSYRDGSPFFGVGMAVPWLVYDSRYYEQPGLFKRLEEHGINLINWLFTSWDIQLLRDSYQSYSMADAKKFDLLLADAEGHGIKLVLGVWIHDLLRDAPHPWSGFYDWQSNPFNQLTSATGFFSDSLSWEYQKKYYRYLIARWGYSPSIAMWHTVAEINGTNAIYDDKAMRNDPDGWHNRINRYFEENDPYGHPTTVSGSGGYDFNEGWEITGVPQAHEYPYPADRIRENPERIAYWSALLNQRYQKPALVGEFGKSLYEEGISESFLHNGIWAGVMSGACATPLHWWGGQISQQPENFSTFNETMMRSLQYLGHFLEGIDMSTHGFKPLYGGPLDDQPSLGNMPEGKIYALKGDSMALCWAYHVDEHSTMLFQGVEVTLPGLTQGQYEISFYEPWRGTWSGQPLLADCREGALTFVCPDFTSDLAMKITWSDSLGVSASGEPDQGRINVFPNPCSSALNIENLQAAGNIRLLSLTGQKVGEFTYADQQHRLSLDLSPCEKGIYLLEIRASGGPARYVKIVRE